MKKLMTKLCSLAAVALLVASVWATEVAMSPVVTVPGGIATSLTGSLTTSQDNYTFANDGRMIIHYKRTAAGSTTITITTPITVNGMPVTDETVVVSGTTGEAFAGPFAPTLYNDGNGKVSFTVNEETGLSFEVLKI